MRANVKKFFEDAQKAILELSLQERLDVMNILSALRGPDNQNEKAKEYTNFIRQAVFPELNEYSRSRFYYEGRPGIPWSGDVVPIRPRSGEWAREHVLALEHNGDQWHFADHIKYAIDAIQIGDPLAEEEEK